MTGVTDRAIRAALDKYFDINSGFYAFWVFQLLRNSMNVKNSSENISDAQIEHASQWVVNFINSTREEFRTTGVPYERIYEDYCTSTNFPIHHKAFAPMLHVCGLERINRSGVVTYILLEVSL